MDTVIEYFQDLWSEPYVKELIYTIIVLVVSTMFIRMSKKILQRIEKVKIKNASKNHRLSTLTKLLYSMTKYVIWILAIVIILSVWGVDIMPALAGLGVLGLVIGLSAQKMISDMIAGFFIIFENHYNVGENIEVSGFRGDVIELGLKSTIIQGWKGELKIYSNSEMTPVINYSRHHATAVINFKVSYGTDIEDVIKKTNAALKTFASTQETLLSEPSVVGISDLMNTMIQLTITCQTKPGAQFGIEREIRKLVLQTLHLQGVNIPLEDVLVTHMEK